MTTSAVTIHFKGAPVLPLFEDLQVRSWLRDALLLLLQKIFSTTQNHFRALSLHDHSGMPGRCMAWTCATAPNLEGYGHEAVSAAVGRSLSWED